MKNFENWEKDALGHYAVRKIFREILSTGLINIVRLFNRPGVNFSFGIIKSLLGKMMDY